MKQKNKNLTFQDVKALFETDLTDLCTLARACSDVDSFKSKLTDYLKFFTKLGQVQEYEISARGGTDRAKYFSSVSYHESSS